MVREERVGKERWEDNSLRPSSLVLLTIAQETADETALDIYIQ